MLVAIAQICEVRVMQAKISMCACAPDLLS